MKIFDRPDLLDVFLDNRVKILYECLVSSSGWKGILLSMMCLLEDPKHQYELYLNERSMTDNKEGKIEGMSKNKGRNRIQGKEIDQSYEDKKGKKNIKKVIVQVLNENKNKKTLEIFPSEKEKKLENEEIQSKCDDPLSFEEFIQRRFDCILKRLNYCIVNLYTHLPTSFISLEVVRNMNLALDFLRSLETLLCTVTVADKGLKQVSGENALSRLGNLMKSSFVRKDCLKILRLLPQKFPVPDFRCKDEIKKF